MSDPKNRTRNDLQELNYLKDEPVASNSDLTGLVQAPPADEAEAEAYAELHSVPVPGKIPERRK